MAPMTPDIRSKIQRFVILNSRECRYLFEKKERDALLALKPGVIHIAGIAAYDGEPHPFHKFHIHDNGPEFDRALKEFTGECHRRGIITTPYICLYTITRSQLDKHPEAREWLTRDAKGNILNQAYYDIAQRFSGCLNNPGWRNHMKDVVRHAIDLGFTAQFYDNPIWFRCECAWCQKKFDDHRRASGRRPAPIPAMMDWESDVWRDYYGFLSECVGDFIGELSRYAKGLCPGHLTYVNTTPPFRMPPATGGLACTAVAKHADIICYEMGRNAPNRRNYVITWNVAAYSYGNAEGRGRPVVTIPYFPDRTADRFQTDYTKLGLAEGFVFGGAEVSPDISFLNRYARVRNVREYFHFMKAHGRALAEASPVADVSVYSSWETQTRYYSPLLQRLFRRSGVLHRSGDVSYEALCAVLANRHVPFRTILDLKDADTPVLILPNIAVLSEQDADAVRSLVRKGTGLLATGETSLFDGLRKLRNYRLADVFGVSWPAPGKVRTTFGKGRVVFLPDRPELDAAQGRSLSKQALFEDLDWIAHGRYTAVASLEDAPDCLLMTVLQSGRTRYVHLLNYRIDDVHGVRPLTGVMVSVRGGVRSARVETPDGKPPEVSVERRKGTTVITVGRVFIYSLLILEE